MSERLRVYTARYFDKALIEESGAAPLGSTVGPPRFGVGYELAGSVGMVTPYGSFKIEDPAEFRRVYRQRLGHFGVDKIKRVLEAFAAGHDTDSVVLLCFCKLDEGAVCHRRVFAEWWREQTGDHVDELRDVLDRVA